MSVFFIIIQLHEVEYNECANQEQIYTGFFKYKITICPNLALYFAENEELLVVYALAICIKNEAGSALFSCSVSDSMIFLVSQGSPHSLSFNRQFNALSFILGEKDEFIITKAKPGGKESFYFFV